ncbi:PhoH family protein [Oceanotoga sp. DSM 15011]|uniref:PhoH family protein n=1 Tax=Oceanotoga TaxID=1255275 RepID=UPI0021F4F6D7|nr:MULTISPECIES: PhoH family protein [Oceanotoga]MDO7975574.1 PhoH family protein [Oceanotoga teriensis]UYO99920.1 PhoH family protein [Oceanotoga sp. DSM 15011]
MKKNYVLDTNVLIHDPESIYKFEDNNVIIPFPVLEEIDGLKNRNDKVAKSAREVNRILDNIRKKGNLQKGIKLKNGGILKILALTSKELKANIPDFLGNSKDDFIIYYALNLKNSIKDIETIFVSKDLNLRIKSESIGIKSEDYLNDKIDMKFMYDGYISKKDLDLNSDTFNLSQASLNKDEIYPNIYLETQNNNYKLNAEKSNFEKINITFNTEILNIKPRNIEQLFALDALLDDSIPFVTLIGMAGTGKTLLALAAGIFMTLELKKYSKLLISKPVIPMGKDIGYLPGSIEEKMKPWLQPIYDNMDYLFSGKGKSPEEYLTKKQLIEIEVLSYIRGRSIPNQYIIIDEAQNLTPAEVKTILTRVGENTKIVLTGDPYQIDNPYLDESSNGLVYAASKFKYIDISSNIIMKKGERSKLASYSAKIL